MKQFGIYFGEIEYSDGTGSKIRPSILLDISEDEDYIYAIAVYSYRKWFDNEVTVSKNFVEIIDWKDAGLKVRSFADTLNIISIHKNVYSEYQYWGQLTDKDIERIKKEL